MSNRLQGIRVAAGVVQEVWRLAGQEGLGAKAIANRLHDRGVAISASTVWRIISREPTVEDIIDAIEFLGQAPMPMTGRKVALEDGQVIDLDALLRCQDKPGSQGGEANQ